jgi:hypothetical protein
MKLSVSKTFHVSPLHFIVTFSRFILPTDLTLVSHLVTCLKVCSRKPMCDFFIYCVHMCTYIVLVCMLSLVCSRSTVDLSWQSAPNSVATLRDRVRFDSR